MYDENFEFCVDYIADLLRTNSNIEIDIFLAI